MKSIISIVVLVASIALGSAGGVMLKSGSGGSDTIKADKADEHAKKDDDHGKKEKDDGHGKKDKHAKKDSHGKEDKHGGKASSDPSKSEYYKFTREFVVPIMRDETVRSLVILNINLEVESGMNSELFSMDPKLRDNIMSTLVALGNDGVTLERMTSAESYETIRSMVKKNLSSVVASGIKNVLIVDLGKQDL